MPLQNQEMIMNKKTYFMFVHADPEGMWCEFPDLEGCMTDGENLEDLMKNAADCLASYAESVVENGDSLPEPSGIEQLTVLAKKCEDPVTFIAPVTTYIPGAPARINVTSTADKIDEITAFAKKVGRTRSELMVKATLDYIRSHA